MIERKTVNESENIFNRREWLSLSKNRGVKGHLQSSHKLDGADEGERMARREVKPERVQEVGSVNLDVHKHVQHLDALSRVYGD